MANIVKMPGGPRDAGLVSQLGQDEVLRVARGKHFTLHNDNVIAEFSPILPFQGSFVVPETWDVYCRDPIGETIDVVEFTSTWTVPDPPSRNDNQTIYLFGGLVNSGVDFGILQPILQWGNNGNFGGPYWTISSAYAVYKSFIKISPGHPQVTPGQTVTSFVKRTGVSPGAFGYTCGFVGHMETEVRMTSETKLTGSYLALESYDIGDCGNYPPNATTVVSGIDLKTSGAAAGAGWAASVNHTQCGQSLNVGRNQPNNSEVTIRYRLPQAGV